jgi:hypothetical protein
VNLLPDLVEGSSAVQALAVSSKPGTGVEFQVSGSQSGSTLTLDAKSRSLANVKLGGSGLAARLYLWDATAEKNRGTGSKHLHKCHLVIAAADFFVPGHLN